MPELMVGQLSISFHGTEPRTRHSSLSGAQVAIKSAGSQCARMLVFYLQRGASTDGEIAALMGMALKTDFPDARVSARRSSLMKAGLVQSEDIVAGPCGAERTRYTLTVKGLHVAGRLAEMHR